MQPTTLCVCVAGFSILLIGSAAAQTRTFFCGEESFVTVTVVSPTTIKAGLIEGQTLTMEQDPSDPFSYFLGDYGLAFKPEQDGIQLMIPDFGTIDCVFQGDGGQDAAAPIPVPVPALVSDFPIEAKSWGGSVRSGPGIDYPKVGNLAEGQRIVILGQSGAELYQDLPWFEISWNNKTGYHWGGIICPIGMEVPGTFQVCN
jgi:hypothetical protein